ncbi:hypothetical protein BCR42DRAFT_399823 [Absidia repens]|uniref:Cyclin-domain-containing protein n=1 Tax=Absidia repens TaxID=90262 RepID=A0A1X2J0J7_9FUNG|nr:hypothetical protein BCR42DRAFT_399823 [Absidia repens]
MALSDGLPHPIPTAALAAFDPPTYLQHSTNEPTLYCLNNNNNSNVNIDLTLKNNPIAAIISPEDEQQLPCEQYKEFLDASHIERVDMIDNLVDVSVDIIDSIWPTPSHAKVVATKGFIREILKRSKTTYFMLQLSLFYIFRVKRVVQAKLRMAAGDRRYRDDLMCCGRRMFLASLMVASKYIHDKSYRNKAWADASGLTLAEINASELAFLQMIDYRLYVSKATFEKWYDMLNQRLKQRKQQQQHQQHQQPRQHQQQQQHQRSYPQQYNHHQLMTTNPIKKPSVKPTTTTTTTATATATCGVAANMKKNAMTNPVTTTASLTSTSSHRQLSWIMNTTPTLSFHNNKPFVTLPPTTATTRSSDATATTNTTHYPSPASPCFYHPDFNVLT